MQHHRGWSKPQRSVQEGHKGVEKREFLEANNTCAWIPGRHTDTSECHCRLDSQLPDLTPGLRSWFSSAKLTSPKPSTPSKCARKLTHVASFLHCVLHLAQPSNKFNTGIIYNMKCIQTQLISSQALLWAAAGKVPHLTTGKLCLSTSQSLGNVGLKGNLPVTSQGIGMVSFVWLV